MKNGPFKDKSYQDLGPAAYNWEVEYDWGLVRGSGGGPALNADEERFNPALRLGFQEGRKSIPRNFLFSKRDED